MEPGMRDCMECQGWSRRPGQSRVRRMVKGQAGGTQFPILPPTSILHLPLHAHLHPRCCLAGCGTGVPAALTAQCRAAGAVPLCQSLPTPGPVPCCDPALCCCLHGPQLSKPCCQTLVPCLFCWEQGWRGRLAQKGLQTQRGDCRFIHGTKIHPFPGEDNRSVGAGRDAGWLGVALLYPVYPVQPCPTGKNNMVALSWPPPSVPRMSSVPRVSDSCTFPVWERADGEHLTTSHWH